MISIEVRVIKKQKIAERMTLYPDMFFGISIKFKDDTEVSPIYPFTVDDRSKNGLLEFVGDYQEKLIEFYSQNKCKEYGNSFSFYLYGFDTKLKERFKERWLQKGVVIS